VAGAAPVVPPAMKKLMPIDIVERRKISQCFHCDDMFTRGHKLVCKHLFVIEVDEDEADQAADAGEPSISIHALTSICPCSGRTMQLFVNTNGMQLLVLINSGSTHNFVDIDSVARAGISLGGKAGLHDTVANGDNVQSLGCCRNVPFSIGNMWFTIDCDGLALDSFKMVLDIQWLESLGPIQWDFAQLMITFTREGR
jgi:hypothetical protein